MTYEEMQKTMQFILEQQAQFTVNIQKMQEAQARSEGKVAELENLVARLAAATVEGFKDVNAKIDALVDAQIRTEESIKRSGENLNARLDALAEAQARTDENLRAKISALADAQARIEESFNAKFDKLVQAQGRTDEAVRNLAELVDRQLRGRRNGG